MKTGKWTWTEDWQAQDAEDVRMVCFRAEAKLDEIPTELWMRCTADTRYKLFVNGQFVQYGPAKGDDKVHYYDRIDIAPWLRTGVNAIAFEALRYPLERYNSNHSLFRTEQPGLFVDCERRSTGAATSVAACNSMPRRRVLRRCISMRRRGATRSWRAGSWPDLTIAHGAGQTD